MKEDNHSLTDWWNKFIWKYVKHKVQYYSIANDQIRIKKGEHRNLNRKESYRLKPFRAAVIIFNVFYFTALSSCFHNILLFSRILWFLCFLTQLTEKKSSKITCLKKWREGSSSTLSTWNLKFYCFQNKKLTWWLGQ